jgi:hypothetical protein
LGVTVEAGVCRGVDGPDVFDGLGGSLVARGFQFSFSLGPVGALVGLCRSFAIHRL